MILFPLGYGRVSKEGDVYVSGPVLNARALDGAADTSCPPWCDEFTRPQLHLAHVHWVAQILTMAGAVSVWAYQDIGGEPMVRIVPAARGSIHLTPSETVALCDALHRAYRVIRPEATGIERPADPQATVLQLFEQPPAS